MWHQTRSSLAKIIGEENLCVRCRDAGCEASLSGFSEHRLVVDAHKAISHEGSGSNRCDCVLFDHGNSNGKLVVVPIELKGGSVRPSSVVRQLQAGAQYVDEVLRRIPASNRLGVSCTPVLVHKGKISKSDSRELKRRQVRFRGTNLMVFTAKCGIQGDVAKRIQR